MSGRRLPWLLVVVVAWLAVGRSARAHEFRPAVLALVEAADGSFVVSSRPALDGMRQPIDAVAPVFPDQCRLDGPRLRCDAPGLTFVRYEGLRAHPVDVVVRVRWADGGARTEVLRGANDTVELDGGVQSTPRLVARFVGLGVEHIALGLDHVLFVLGLAMLVGFRRRLVWTVTGFTLAHSLTLGASALGLVEVDQGPVEAVIAISIVLLAWEILRDRPSLTRRAPGLVAFGFGLLHGFGFAGALREIGLPPDRAWTALLGFNVGVELGQLALLGAAWLVARAVGGRVAAWPWLPRAATYAGGSLAVAWTIERTLAL